MARKIEREIENLEENANDDFSAASSKKLTKQERDELVKQYTDIYVALKIFDKKIENYFKSREEALKSNGKVKVPEYKLDYKFVLKKGESTKNYFPNVYGKKLFFDSKQLQKEDFSQESENVTPSGKDMISSEMAWAQLDGRFKLAFEEVAAFIVPGKEEDFFNKCRNDVYLARDLVGMTLVMKNLLEKKEARAFDMMIWFGLQDRLPIMKQYFNNSIPPNFEDLLKKTLKDAKEAGLSEYELREQVSSRLSNPIVEIKKAEKYSFATDGGKVVIENKSNISKILQMVSPDKDNNNIPKIPPRIPPKGEHERKKDPENENYYERKEAKRFIEEKILYLTSIINKLKSVEERTEIQALITGLKNVPKNALITVANTLREIDKKTKQIETLQNNPERQADLERLIRERDELSAKLGSILTGKIIVNDPYVKSDIETNREDIASLKKELAQLKEKYAKTTNLEERAKLAKKIKEIEMKLEKVKVKSESIQGVDLIEAQNTKKVKKAEKENIIKDKKEKYGLNENSSLDEIKMAYDEIMQIIEDKNYTLNDFVKFVAPKKALDQSNTKKINITNIEDMIEALKTTPKKLNENSFCGKIEEANTLISGILDKFGVDFKTTTKFGITKEDLEKLDGIVSFIEQYIKEAENDESLKEIFKSKAFKKVKEEFENNKKQIEQKRKLINKKDGTINKINENNKKLDKEKDVKKIFEILKESIDKIQTGIEAIIKVDLEEQDFNVIFESLDKINEIINGEYAEELKQLPGWDKFLEKKQKAEEFTLKRQTRSITNKIYRNAEAVYNFDVTNTDKKYIDEQLKRFDIIFDSILSIKEDIDLSAGGSDFENFEKILEKAEWIMLSSAITPEQKIEFKRKLESVKEKNKKLYEVSKKQKELKTKQKYNEIKSEILNLKSTMVGSDNDRKLLIIIQEKYDIIKSELSNNEQSEIEQLLRDIGENLEKITPQKFIENTISKLENMYKNILCDRDIDIIKFNQLKNIFIEAKSSGQLNGVDPELIAKVEEYFNFISKEKGQSFEVSESVEKVEIIGVSEPVGKSSDVLREAQQGVEGVTQGRTGAGKETTSVKIHN